MGNKIIKKNNINQLRNIIREESRYGALQAHLMLQGCDIDTIQDNEVLEYKAKEVQTTPLLKDDYKKGKRKDLLIKVAAVVAVIGLVASDIADISVIKLIVDVLL